MDDTQGQGQVLVIGQIVYYVTHDKDVLPAIVTRVHEVKLGDPIITEGQPSQQPMRFSTNLTVFSDTVGQGYITVFDAVYDENKNAETFHLPG